MTKQDIIIEKLDKVTELLEKIIEQGNRAEEFSKRSEELAKESMERTSFEYLLETTKKLSEEMMKLQQETQPKKKYLVEDYNSPLEPVPWWVHSPQYNNGFTCCADTSSELITKPCEETPHELKIK